MQNEWICHRCGHKSITPLVKRPAERTCATEVIRRSTNDWLVVVVVVEAEANVEITQELVVDVLIEGHPDPPGRCDAGVHPERRVEGHRIEPEGGVLDGECTVQ